VNRAELEAAQRELTHDVMAYWRQHLILAACGGGEDAPAHVPGWVVPRLNRLGRKLGYSVGYQRRLDGALGETLAEYNPDEYRPRGITIKAGMTDASTARTTCHELAHAICNETTLRDDGRRLLQCLLRGREDGELEEVIAETTAALCARALRIDSGDEFSLWFLAARAAHNSPAILDAAGPEAVRLAEVILKGIA
jgi:hypothetical protein